jgi:asparagine synthase (glutamine-hydrolysing)
MTENLFDVSLPSDMLRKVDMMSMLASIEVRVPLLDEGVVDLGLTLPHRLKTDGRQCKRVLRTLADRWLPPAVAGHPKHGFSIPLDILLTDDFFEMLEDTLLGASSRTRALFNSALLRQWVHMLRLARAGKRQSSIGREGLYQRIFMALSMEFWMRKYSLSW